ncbi:hypothetical protein [uncultured Dialister sp.]|jgi:hypothetical protein|uniref:phage baseplate protein n=1 Tax=uncultured Dialister sp. TaxID=278064 RepID=UPI0027DE95EF|nr:hypothetical protein [uncultured Dialister sp.]
MVIEMDSGRRVSTGLQPLQDCIGYAESAKESAVAAASSQSAAAGSESVAASSASASASSASAAKTSEANAKTSENNAAKSASAAAASARTRQADWSETDNTLQSYIKNKPGNLVYTDGDQQISGAKTFTGKLEASTVNAANLSVSGAASVPTPNADNNSKTVANTAFVKTAIANLVGSAPSTLDTLQELSAALGNDANFSATVASQIGKKLDKAGGTITGPILYGKTPNDNSELPNKAYVDSAIKSAVNAAVASVTKTLSANMHAQYPVGCYLYSDKANNPVTYLPYMSDTTWVQTAAGRVLIGAGEADSGTVYNAGATGGEEKHKLSVEELAPHMHQERMTTSDGNPNSLVNLETGGNLSGATVPQRFGYTHKATDTVNTVSAGGDKPHNNMEPYRVVYIFKRTV